VAPHQKTSGKTTPEGVVGPQTFRSVTAVIVWWVWVLFAVGNLIDLAVQGRDHFAAVVAAILVLSIGVAYVTAERPRVISADEGITVRNPLRDHRVPWHMVTKVDLADLLRVHCRQQGKNKVISCWAVQYSRRRKLTGEMRSRRQSVRATRAGFGNQPFGVPNPGFARTPAPAADSSPEADAERIARLLNDRATAAGIEQATAAAAQPAGAQPAAAQLAAAQLADTGHQDPEQQTAARQPRSTADERLRSTWSWQALAALGVPALILMIVALL
jgi:hypothetical protein